MSDDKLFIPLIHPYGRKLATVPLPDSDGFLTDVQFGSPAGHPDVCLIQASWNPDRFDEQLFTSLLMPSPPHLTKAVRKRRAEYLASRVLVRHGLSCLGAEPWVLVNDADRAPVWPQGFTGSLSHSHQRIALLLLNTACHKLAGVDCEKVMRPETAEKMQAMIITVAEKGRLLESGLPLATALTVAFSLKESLYKALYPQLRQFMDFSAAEIMSCQPDTGEIRLRLTASFSSEFPAGREFTGKVRVTPTEVLSWVIDPSPSDC